ncbi:ComF family protein [Companilactobacillus furfuricola]|uniref:ComF family protein n=1 Tax=Companilactobacillus furfuricola TaxID=1462575 RepID=UPI000F79D641|nr:ComF family protein [Companilactobacillus furfuricola]
MSNCLNCGQNISKKLNLSEIFLWNEMTSSKLCSYCQKQLVTLPDKEHCPNCFKLGSREICLDCVIWQNKYKIFNQHFAIYEYNQFIHDYFKSYKRYGDVLLAQLFASEIKRWSKQFKFDLITYIPSSASHFNKRGFDPVYELYKDIFQLTPVFEKVDADKPQAQKNKQERMNTPQTFKIRSDFRQKDHDMQILIVDDIYTTGRTILHARQLLYSQGFQKIQTFSLTR